MTPKPDDAISRALDDFETVCFEYDLADPETVHRYDSERLKLEATIRALPPAPVAGDVPNPWDDLPRSLVVALGDFERAAREHARDVEANRDTTQAWVLLGAARVRVVQECAGLLRGPVAGLPLRGEREIAEAIYKAIDPLIYDEPTTIEIHEAAKVAARTVLDRGVALDVEKMAQRLCDDTGWTRDIKTARKVIDALLKAGRE